MNKGLREVLEMIVVDCEADVAAQDGQPLTGKNVAKWFGETLAMVQALSRVNLVLLDRIEEVERVARLRGWTLSEATGS